MIKNDRKHFESYREQTAAKHTILEKYIVAYFNILKANHKRLVYIDGFAGRGTYTNAETGEKVDGSPLRALRKIASHPDLSSRVVCVFIEHDSVLTDDLKTCVEQFKADHPNMQEAHVAVGAFAHELQSTLDHLDAKGSRLAPTFLFVDPCGVAGVSFSAIQRFMKNDSCELLLFFNIDGIRRILGLGEKMAGTLVELLGSEPRARELQVIVAGFEESAKREQCIIQFYEDLMKKETGADFVTAFRVEKEVRRITSHYLLRFQAANRSEGGSTRRSDRDLIGL